MVIGDVGQGPEAANIPGERMATNTSSQGSVADSSNMMSLEFLVTNFLSPSCYDELVVKSNYFHEECMALVMSKLVGYAIIVSSTFLSKLPQLLKLLGARSAEGLSFGYMLSSLLSLSASICYAVPRELPFSTWGESLILALQTLAIALLILLYQGQTRSLVLFLTGYITFMVVMLSPFIPPVVTWGFAMLSLPMLICGKVLQISTNYRNGSTGQLSAVSIGVVTLRSVGRLFTSFMETNDNFMISKFAVSSLLNSVIMGQVLYYWNSRIKTKKVE